MSDLRWGVGDVNMTCLVGYLDLLPAGFTVTVARLEALSGMSTDTWGADGWWGIHGTFNGATFTLYEHKHSGRVHIGAHGTFFSADIAGLNGPAPPLNVTR